MLNALTQGFPIDDLSSRGTIVLSLMLTAVAFRMYVTSQLPNVSYLTLLDIHLIGGFALFFLQGIGFLLNRIVVFDDASKAFFNGFILLCTLTWIIGVLTYILVVARLRQSRIFRAWVDLYMKDPSYLSTLTVGQYNAMWSQSFGNKVDEEERRVDERDRIESSRHATAYQIDEKSIEARIWRTAINIGGGGGGGGKDVQYPEHAA